MQFGWRRPASDAGCAGVRRLFCGHGTSRTNAQNSRIDTALAKRGHDAKPRRERIAPNEATASLSQQVDRGGGVMAVLDTIWEGDKLERKQEARLLERFLNREVEALATMKRDQAFVLALDAQYGEGKTWF